MLLTLTEMDIHSIIRNYPYLVNERFGGMQIKHEYVYPDRTRSDFVFVDDSLSAVVEVKKGSIDRKMILQLDGYVLNEQRDNPNRQVSGTLVGRNIVDQIRRLADVKHYDVRLLDIDVPTTIRLCARKNCRKATSYSNEKCPCCGSKKFIVDPFLF